MWRPSLRIASVIITVNIMKSLVLLHTTMNYSPQESRRLLK